MKDTEEAFGVDPTVSDDTDDTGHEERSDTHEGIDRTDLFAIGTKLYSHISSKRDEPGSPGGELEEVHYSQPEFDVVVLHCFEV